MALPLMRRRGPGISPWLMASRTAVSAEPAPSVPMSRSAVKPAIRSALAACSASMVRQGTDSSDGLQVFRAGMQEEMHVRVDEAGEQRDVAEVDDGCVRRMVDGCADGADALALDENFAGSEEQPVSTWSRRAAWSTMGAVAACCACAGIAAASANAETASTKESNAEEIFGMDTDYAASAPACR